MVTHSPFPSLHAAVSCLTTHLYGPFEHLPPVEFSPSPLLPVLMCLPCVFFQPKRNSCKNVVVFITSQKMSNIYTNTFLSTICRFFLTSKFLILILITILNTFFNNNNNIQCNYHINFIPLIELFDFITLIIHKITHCIILIPIAQIISYLIYKIFISFINSCLISSPFRNLFLSLLLI